MLKNGRYFKSYIVPQSGNTLYSCVSHPMKLPNFLKPKPPQLTIDNYGQPTTIDPEQIQSLYEWLFASLLNAGYVGRSHIIWYDSDNPDPSLEKAVKKAMRRNEPIFLYRCGGRAMQLPEGYYWRMMDEHPSMRIYQLEVKDDG